MKRFLSVIFITVSAVSQRLDCDTMADVPEEIFQKTEAAVSLPDIHTLIETAAMKYKVPAEFIRSIVAAESNFNPLAVSPKGAVGLMQLMPETARKYGGDPKIPAQNIEAGTRYLSFLLQRYRRTRHPLTSAIAAYNAGPGAVDRYRGIPPFRETRGYVVRVLAFLRKFHKSGRRGAEGSDRSDLEASVPANDQEPPSF
jgi:soluble lytic murein transglycosylase-like protein